MSSAESSSNRAAVAPVPTSTWYTFVSGPGVGLSMSNAPATTESATGVTPTSPDTEVFRSPVKPGVTVKFCEPLADASACTSLGADTVTGRTAIGERTRWEPSDQVNEPTAQSPRDAVSRVKVTVKSFDSPGGQAQLLRTDLDVEARQAHVGPIDRGGRADVLHRAGDG